MLIHTYIRLQPFLFIRSLSISKWFHPWALLRDQETSSLLISMLVGLEALPFNLDEHSLAFDRDEASSSLDRHALSGSGSGSMARGGVGSGATTSAVLVGEKNTLAFSGACICMITGSRLASSGDCLLACSLVWLVGWLFGWLVGCLLVCWFVGLLVCWFVCWFVGLFVGLLARRVMIPSPGNIYCRIKGVLLSGIVAHRPSVGLSDVLHACMRVCMYVCMYVCIALIVVCCPHPCHHFTPFD
jgi:hypothetical protein